MSENLLLVHEAAGKFNGGNIHRGTALLRAYQNALDLANDTRTRDRRGARRRAKEAEQALRSFCEAAQ